MQDARNAGRKGRLSLIARVAVAAVAILWVFRGQDWSKLAAVFQRLSLWYFSLGLVAFAAAQVILAVRWWLLLRAQWIYIDVPTAVRLFFLGLFYNNVMPGAVGGDLLKAWYITRHTNKRLEGVLSVFVDRAIGLTGLVLMAILAYFAFMRGQIMGGTKSEGASLSGWLSEHRGAILWAGAAVGAALTVLLLHPYGRMRIKHVVARIRQRGVAMLQRAKDAIVVYCSKPWTLLLALTLTFISQSMVIASLWLLGRNLGIEAGLAYYFFIFPVMWVVGAVPISIAGLGVLEGGIVELFVRLASAVENVDNLAKALALCQRFIWVLASLPGGLVHLLGAHLPRDISIDGQEPIN